MRRGFVGGAFTVLLAALAASRASALVIALDPDEIAPKAGGGSGSPGPEARAPEPRAPETSPVTVEATVSKPEVAAGESFALELRANGPAGTTFTFPAELVTDTFELRSIGPAEGQAGPPAPAADPGRHGYEAAVFALTEAQVPPLTVKYRLPDGREGEATTEALPLRVVSRLPKDADPGKIADVRGPLSLAIGRAFWLTLAAATLALAALVFWRRRRRRGAAPTGAVVAPVDPAVEARAALQALVASGVLARGDHRGFYIALTAIAKRYLERRLAAPVLEMTTAETVAFLRDSEKASGLVGPMRDLAGAADRIKFARAAGLSAEAERHREAVLSMIATMEAAFAPPPAAAPSAAPEKVA